MGLPISIPGVPPIPPSLPTPSSLLIDTGVCSLLKSVLDGKIKAFEDAANQLGIAGDAIKIAVSTAASGPANSLISALDAIKSKAAENTPDCTDEASKESSAVAQDKCPWLKKSFPDPGSLLKGLQLDITIKMSDSVTNINVPDIPGLGDLPTWPINLDQLKFDNDKFDLGIPDQTLDLDDLIICLKDLCPDDYSAYKSRIDAAKDRLGEGPNGLLSTASQAVKDEMNSMKSALDGAKDDINKCTEDLLHKTNVAGEAIDASGIPLNINDVLPGFL